MWEGLLTFSSLSGHKSCPASAILLFLSFFFHPTQLYGDTSCAFSCLRSSASVQQVLCENCSICRCILDAFVGKDELHILLLLCRLEDLLILESSPDRQTAFETHHGNIDAGSSHFLKAHPTIRTLVLERAL